MLDREGVTEIPTGSLAVYASNYLPGRNIQVAFHMIHRFAHKMPGWVLTRNDKKVQVIRRSK